MGYDASGRMKIACPRAGDVIPAHDWTQPKPDITLVRENQMRRRPVQDYQNVRLRWCWSRSSHELESPSYMTGFDIPEYNVLLSRIEAEGKEVSQVIFHFCPETVTETGLWMRLGHYGFTRCESRADYYDGYPVPELVFVGKPVRWSR